MLTNLTHTIEMTTRSGGVCLADASIVAAVSGGADSCAMLHALARLRDEFGVRLLVAHYNHGIRGQDALEDEDAVRDQAASLEVPCVVGRGDAPGAQRRLHMSLEEAARTLRHWFLERTAIAHGARWIALAHTADDRAETLLLNLFRGTGPTGMVAMRAVSGRIVRPMIRVTRCEVEDYCRANGVAWREDPSNVSIAHARNRVRHRLLPRLERDFGPGVASSIVRFGDLMQDENDAMDRLAADAITRSRVAIEPARQTLARASLGAEPVAVQRRAVRIAIGQLNGGLRDVGMSVVDTALRRTEGRICLPGANVVLEMSADTLTVARCVAPSSIVPRRVALVPPGTAAWPIGAIRIGARVEPAPYGPLPPARCDRALLAHEHVVYPLSVKTWAPGDRMCPLGSPGSRKLHDIFTDRRIAAEVRRRLPVVCDQLGPIWVPGVVLAERARITSGTRCVLSMWTEPLVGTC